MFFDTFALLYQDFGSHDLQAYGALHSTVHCICTGSQTTLTAFGIPGVHISLFLFETFITEYDCHKVHIFLKRMC